MLFVSVMNGQGCQKHMPLIFVRGSNIRFVHIPDNVNIMQAVEERRLVLDRAALAYMGGKGLAPTPKALETRIPDTADAAV
jgi:hypothetical protein